MELTNPIKTPKSPKEIHALDGGLLNRKGKSPTLRYAERVSGRYALEKGKGIKTVEKGYQVVTTIRGKEKKRINIYMSSYQRR